MVTEVLAFERFFENTPPSPSLSPGLFRVVRDISESIIHEAIFVCFQEESRRERGGRKTLVGEDFRSVLEATDGKASLFTDWSTDKNAANAS